MTHLHTSAAVEEYLRAREELFQAMRTDRGNGTSAQEIALTAAGTYSSQTILEYLSCAELCDAVRAALRGAALSHCVGVRSTGPGPGPCEVRAALTRDPAELTDGERQTLPENLVKALCAAGVAARPAAAGVLAEVLFRGEEIRLRPAPHSTPGRKPHHNGGRRNAGQPSLFFPEGINARRSARTSGREAAVSGVIGRCG
jgi:hypothetical protein